MAPGILRGPFPGWNIALVWVCILFFALLHVRRLPERTPAAITEVTLLYILGIGGFAGIVSGIMHIVLADAIAESIGWPAGNPFQTELAFASIAIGTIGYLCFWRRDFWLPAIIAKSIFALGAGVTHIVDIIQRGNLAVGNAGPILYADLLVPLINIGLYLLLQRYRERGHRSVLR